jgi:hypothetical protein
MRAIVTLAAIAGCGGSPPATATPQPPVRASVPPDAAPPAPPHRVYRKLVVNGQTTTASRTTFTLAIDRDHAELLELDETTEGVRSIADDPRAATWRTIGSHSYRGTAHVEQAATILDLATAGQQPLHMRCAAITVTAASAGARRVASGTRGDTGCDAGRWEPPASIQVAALACGEGAGPDEAADADDDDRLVFGDTVELEYAFENDGCALRGGGLRQTPR